MIKNNNTTFLVSKNFEKKPTEITLSERRKKRTMRENDVETLCKQWHPWQRGFKRVFSFRF